MDVFERNRHGHIILTITGLDLTGAEEVERLKSAGYRVTGDAERCFTSLQGHHMIPLVPSYDARHRLVAGQRYEIALVPGLEIAEESKRTTENLRALHERYAYTKPLAGIIPRVRELVSNEQMEQMGFWCIAALHDPIYFDSAKKVLNANLYNYGGASCVDGHFAERDDEWKHYVAFASLDPTS